MVVEAPESEEGKRAALILRLLHQEDAEVAQSWRKLGLPPWKEALIRLLEIHGVPKSDFLMLCYSFAMAPDGTAYLLSGRRVFVIAPDGRYLLVRDPEGSEREPFIERDGLGRAVLDHTPSLFPPKRLVLSPDGSRLYATSADGAEIWCLDAHALRGGHYQLVWRYRAVASASPSQDEAGGAVKWISLICDGTRVLWAQDHGARGVLDAMTGVLLAYCAPAEFWSRIRARWTTFHRLGEIYYRLAEDRSLSSRDLHAPAGMSADGRVVYLPIMVYPEPDEIAASPVRLFSGGVYHPEIGYNTNPPLAAWLCIDAKTGEVAGVRPNPWAPHAAFAGPTRSTIWSYEHLSPVCTPIYPPGLLVVQSAGPPFDRAVIVNLSTLEALAWTSESHSTVTAVAGAIGSVTVEVSHEEMDAANFSWWEAPEHPATPAMSFRAALALLRECRAGTLPNEPSAAAKAAAWHNLWSLYLRGIDVSCSRPSSGDASVAAQQPVLEPKLLAPRGQWQQSPVRVPVRFAPPGFTITADREWVCVPGIYYVSPRTGRAACRVRFSRSYDEWHLAKQPDSERVLALMDLYGGYEFDASRGHFLHFYNTGPFAFGFPLGRGKWLVRHFAGGKGQGLWILNGDTGCVEDAVPFEGRVRSGECVGITEDGARILIPVDLPRKLGNGTQVSDPGWALFDLRKWGVVGQLTAYDVLTNEAVAVIRAANMQRKEPLASVIPGTLFPWSNIWWHQTTDGQFMLGGNAGKPIVVPSVGRVSLGGGGGGGGTITIMVPR